VRLHLRNFALDIGAKEGHRGYVGFIILGTGRTGSNLLRLSLERHPQVVVFGELFRRPGLVGWDRWPYEEAHHGQSRRALSLIETDPAAFLETRIFTKLPLSVCAVGFNLFYFHALESCGKRVWTYLESQKDLRVIHIRRRNMLRRHLSEMKALRSNSWLGGWWSGPPDGREDGPVCLDYEECRSALAQTREWEAAYDRRFQDHPKTDVFYEDLSADFKGEMRRVQAFLELDSRDLEPKTFKQSRLPLSEAISNYPELKKKFSGTPQEGFFEE
jgi:LPS sulfotransferase NodH